MQLFFIEIVRYLRATVRQIIHNCTNRNDVNSISVLWKRSVRRGIQRPTISGGEGTTDSTRSGVFASSSVSSILPDICNIGQAMLCYQQHTLVISRSSQSKQFRMVAGLCYPCWMTKRDRKTSHSRDVVSEPREIQTGGRSSPSSASSSSSEYTDGTKIGRVIVRRSEHREPRYSFASELQRVEGAFSRFHSDFAAPPSSRFGRHKFHQIKLQTQKPRFLSDRPQ